MHTIKTTVLADANGQITGYGLTIEAQAEGDQAEISAMIAESLAIMIGQLAARTQPPAQAMQAQPPAQPQAQRPASAEEAEQRFFARYAATIGGQSWQAVQAYLHSRAPKPITIDGWIGAAEAVRDQAERAQQPTTPPARRPATVGRRSNRAAA